MTALPRLAELETSHEFIPRHIGPDAHDEERMLAAIAVIAHSATPLTRSELIATIVPRSIARSTPMALPEPLTEASALAELKAIASRNQIGRAHV